MDVDDKKGAIAQTDPMLEFPRIIGHRGAAALAPENTLAGIRAANRMGAPWVEFDVKLTQDRRAVLLHDATLDRTTTGNGRLRETTLEGLGRLDAGLPFSTDFAGETVPTLEEALDLLIDLDMGCNIEIKPDEGLEDETARIALEIAADMWPAKSPPPLVSSFATEALTTAREMLPDWPRGLLGAALPDDWRERAVAIEASSIHLARDKITPQIAAMVKDAGLALAAYTVNEPDHARKLFSLGVDAVFTDDPQGLLAGL